jgi:hypothetical protein
VAQIKIFEEIGIAVEVYLPGKRWQDNPLEVGEHGILAIPKGLQPAAFHLALFILREERLVIVQKNVGQDKGGYHRHALVQLETETDKLITLVLMYDPIQVIRRGQNVWTGWHVVKPNRVDCWFLGKNGSLKLVQIGVITHDDGQTFRLLKEPRWQGRILRKPNGELVARPDDQKWGPLLWNEGESRADIREHPDFQKLLADATLMPWNGSPEELNPPLGPIPEGDYARVDWYITFAGQKGQGIAKLADGSSVWVIGQDLDVPPDGDGIIRLYHNDLLTYVGIHKNWGRKKEGLPKLLCVRRG